MRIRFQNEPYTYLFPVGLLSAVLGAILWLLFQMQIISFYPRAAHGHLMYFGFLWSYIAGFLMTAIPKMTQSKSARSWEILVAIGLVCGQVFLNYTNQLEYVSFVTVAQMVFIIVFVARRFFMTQIIPFSGFVFLPVALVAGFLGSLIQVWSFSQNTIVNLPIILNQAFVLNLICGLGSRLIPVLSRLPQAINPDVVDHKKQLKEIVLVLVFLNLGFVFEAFNYFQLGSFVKFLSVFYISFRFFKIHQRPTVNTFLGWGLRVSIVTMLIGYLLSAILMELNSLATMHLVFIGSFTAITILISTRVTLAHGGLALDFELTTKTLVLVTLCFVISAISRMLAGLNVLSLYIVTSIAFYLLGLLLWSWKLIKPLLKINANKV